MKKLAVIINGKGGVGKDMLCTALAKYHKTVNVSSITPIKEIAEKYGWQGEKDERSRRFLAGLKTVFSEYNDLPNRYVLSEYEKFLNGTEEIFIVHIREATQIARFKNSISGRCVTLLITVPENSPRSPGIIGNDSDDNVCDYSYDFYYNNSKPLGEAEEDFVAFFKENILSKQSDS